jgi:DNA-binding YbaB/EbfC family protein
VFHSGNLQISLSSILDELCYNGKGKQMKRGYFMRGMGNMQQMMKQAQKLQKQMVEAQEALNAQMFEGVSTNDYVKVSISGDRKLTAIEINQAIVDPEDIEMLNDMVMMAVNDGLAKVEEAHEQTMGRYTKGLPF